MLRIVCKLLVLVGCILSSCTAKKEEQRLPYYNTPDFTPLWLNTREAVLKEIPHCIDHFTLTDQDGEQVTYADLYGHIHVANFFFTSCPSFCPKMTVNMVGIQEKFKNDKDVLLVSYSVTPWQDSVPRLKAYAKNHGVISGKWFLLTGNTAEIYKLARTSYFAEEDLGFTKDSTDFLHTENVLLIDKSGRIRGLYKGTLPLEMKRLEEDIALLKKEEWY